MSQGLRLDGAPIIGREVCCPEHGLRAGVHLLPAHVLDVEAEGRGSKVYVRFFCEHGCRFNIEFQFHKGQVFAFHTITGQFSPSESHPEELWRD